MEKITIREFVPQDRVDQKNALLPAFLEIWNAEENLKYLSVTMKPLDQEVVCIWLENHKAQGGRYFCALNQDGKILGIAVVRVNPIEGFELYGIGLRPGFKRQGIGRQLIEHAIGVAEKLEFKAIDAAVFADNAPMLGALISLDFIPVDMDCHKRADGADTVRMKRYL